MLVYCRVYFIAWFRQVRSVVWFMHFRWGTCFFRKQCIRDGSAGICSCFIIPIIRWSSPKICPVYPHPTQKCLKSQDASGPRKQPKETAKTVCVLGTWKSGSPIIPPATRSECTCCCSAQKKNSQATAASYLEDHPRTRKGWITIVSKFANWGSGTPSKMA